MDWAGKRKLIYATAACVFILASSLYVTRDILFPTPTCFDSKKNGYETGLDCGGACSLRCESETAPIVVDWALPVKVGPTTYDFVAMLSNRNIDSAPKSVSYTFIALNKAGNPIANVSGETLALVDGAFPIIKQEVQLKEVPVRLLAKIDPVPYYKTAEKPRVPLIRVKDFVYEPGDIRRITVTIVNTTRNVYLKLPVRLVAFDENDNAVAVGESILPSLEKEEEKNVVFTWHYPLTSTPTKIRAYPMLDPFNVPQ